MINKIYITILFIAAFSSASLAQLKTPAMSPSAEIKQTIGLTTVEVIYSRPSARGRKIFGTGGLILDNNFWRTGANSATKISFSDDVMIGNQSLEKGDYTILSKPNANSWTINFYSYDRGSWTSYVEKEPTLTLNVKPIQLHNFVESFTISIDDIEMNTANLVFAWERTKVVIPIEVELHKRVMSAIEKTMSGPSLNDYFQAASYLHETGTDLNKALTYVQKVTKGEGALFFQVYREALILGDLHRNKEAIEAAKRSLDLSKKRGNDDFVRLNTKLIEKLSK